MCVKNKRLLAMQHPAPEFASQAEGGYGRPVGDRQPDSETGDWGRPVERMESPGLHGQDNRYDLLRLPLPKLSSAEQRILLS
jgi:hypothetical protein